MKRFLQAIIALLLLAVALVLVGILLKPMLNDAISALSNTLFGNDDPTGKTVPVTLFYYRQDPDSGEYAEDKRETRGVVQGEPLTIEAPAVEHYTLNTERSTLYTAEVKKDDTFALYYDCQTCQVTFVGGENAVLTAGETQMTLRKGQQVTPPVFSKTGYTFLGYDAPVEALYEDTVFTAAWSVNHYTLRLYTIKGSTLDSDGFAERSDAAGCFERTFTVHDSLVLPVPSCPDANFLSWNTAADGSGSTVTALSEGTDCEITLYALIDRIVHTIDFAKVDGVTYPSILATAGEKVYAPYIDPANQKPGMGLNWYTDAACTNPYVFTVMPSENLTLYGQWEKDTGSGFLNWNMETKTVDSADDLIAFMDYILYYDLQKSVTIEVTYAAKAQVQSDLARLSEAREFRAGGTLVYTVDTKRDYQNSRAQCYITAYIQKSVRNSEASLSSPAQGITPYRYLGNTVSGARGSSYTDFYIDSLKNTFPVTTTNQLLYVVEHGYRPLPKQGSAAERIYNAARALLNQILPPDASDYEKVLAIYDYLVLNIEYDHTVADASAVASFAWYTYDAYYLEGVFDKGKAVCDGIAKAFSLLCNIEGIPCVEVSGNSHAWVRVKVGGAWYVADATFGNLHLENYAHTVVDHGEFLISDVEKALSGYVSKSYAYIHAEASYDYFADQTFLYQGKAYDFVITDVEELAALLGYLLLKSPDLSDCSIDFLYRIEGTTFFLAYQDALVHLKDDGLTMPFTCVPFHATYNSVAKAVFTQG